MSPLQFFSLFKKEKSSAIKDCGEATSKACGKSKTPVFDEAATLVAEESVASKREKIYINKRLQVPKRKKERKGLMDDTGALQVDTYRILLIIVMIYLIETIFFGQDMWTLVKVPTEVDAGFFQTGWAYAQFFLNLLVFNLTPITGMPEVLRWAITTPILVGLFMTVINIIRG